MLRLPWWWGRRWTPIRATLRPYTPLGPCPQCGHRWNRTRHVYIPHDPDLPADGLIREFYARKCRRCGYEWNEALPDAAESAW